MGEGRAVGALPACAPAPKVYAVGPSARSQRVHLLRRSTRSVRRRAPSACTCCEGLRVRSVGALPARAPAQKVYAFGPSACSQRVHLLRRSTCSVRRHAPSAYPCCEGLRGRSVGALPARTPAAKVYAFGPPACSQRVPLLRRSTRSVRRRAPSAYPCCEGLRGRSVDALPARAPAPKVYAFGPSACSQRVHLLRRSTCSVRRHAPSAYPCCEGLRGRSVGALPACAPAAKVYAVGPSARSQRVDLLRRSTRSVRRRAPSACTRSEGLRVRSVGTLPARIPAAKVYAVGPPARSQRVHLLRRPTRSVRRRAPSVCTCCEGLRGRSAGALPARSPASKVYAFGPSTRSQRVPLLRRSTRSVRRRAPSACTCCEGLRGRSVDALPARTPAAKVYAVGPSACSQRVPLLRRSTHSVRRRAPSACTCCEGLRGRSAGALRPPHSPKPPRRPRPRPYAAHPTHSVVVGRAFSRPAGICSPHSAHTP